MREVGATVFAALFFASVQCEALEWNTVTIDCKLSPASILTLDQGKLIPERVDSSDKVILFTFTGFDEKSNSATVVANQGSNRVLFFDVGGHIQLIEVTDSRNVATTTITVNGQAINATQTRHMAMMGGGVFSVYSGPCRIR